jgi:hypothetical protein
MMQMTTKMNRTGVARKPAPPPVPVVYADAIKALRQCTTFDDAKGWDDRSEALDAWARIFKQDEALIEAKRLKLHAYRRMGEIAAELRPVRGNNGNSPDGKGRLPGPQSLLIERGLNKQEASAARALAQVPERKFERLLDEPLSPTTVADQLTRRDPVWRGFAQYAQMLRSKCRKYSPTQVATVVRKLGPKRVEAAKSMAAELLQWLSEFERRLK